MAIDKFFDRMKVEFKEPMGSNELESLLAHISADLKCKIEYQIIQNKSIASSGEGYEAAPTKVICGRIIKSDLSKNCLSMAPFHANECVDKKSYCSREMFSGIEFSGLNGYGISNLPKPYLALIKNVRKVVKSYERK